MEDASSIIDPAGLNALTDRIGDYTRGLYSGYSNARPLSAKEAALDLQLEIRCFSERLLDYVCSRYRIDPLLDEGTRVKRAKKALREASRRKGFEFSSANLSQWFVSNKAEVYLSPQTIFRLCLAMELDIESAAHFVYDCLYQNWFNYRVPEEAVYFFFVGAQAVFGDDAYSRATGIVAQIGDVMRDSTNYAEEYEDATGYTSVLGGGIKQLIDCAYHDESEAENALVDYLRRNAPMFTGLRRSANRLYSTYFKDGGICLEPLISLYAKREGLTLPETSYLDMSGVGADIRRKRLLWGSANRAAWLNQNDKDWDVLNEKEIKIEHHAVDAMQRSGITRGNIIAVLFFHFCLENETAFKTGDRRQLFEKFYRVTNLTLVDECGMMPLHPRKLFDRLWLTSIANSSGMNPIEYLNKTLERFYLT